MNSYQKGIKAEKQAYFFLLRQNFTIVSRRFKTQDGEIDIIAKRNEKYFIIEIKKRKSILKAIASIQQKQMQRCINAFYHFALQNNIDHENVEMCAVLIGGNEMVLQFLNEEF